jgi:6-pyruvoyltetrahydropterin/6-carboxytetrahydropterin synthase
MSLTLTRELRIGLHPSDHPSIITHPSPNGFAANPALTDIAPFLLLKASITGPIDPDTGMLINIKIVDQVLRQHAVPLIRDAYYNQAENQKSKIENLLPQLLTLLETKFTPHSLTKLTLALSPYLSFSIHKKDPHMITTSQRFEFSAAHRLHSSALSEKQNHDVFGRCNNPNGHGHNYEIEVTLAGTPDPNTGHLLPDGIPQLQKLVNETIIDRFDHKHLNLDCAEFSPQSGINPTVENIARIIYQKLKPTIPAPTKLHCIKVWETPKTVAEYSE